MEISLDTSATPARLTLAGELTIYCATEAKSRLLAPLDEGSAVDALDIDLAAVGEIDSAGLQLLILARQQAAANGKTLSIGAISAQVCELLELYGLAAFFGDPAPVAGAPDTDTDGKIQ